MGHMVASTGVPVLVRAHGYQQVSEYILGYCSALIPCRERKRGKIKVERLSEIQMPASLGFDVDGNLPAYNLAYFPMNEGHAGNLSRSISKSNRLFFIEVA